MKLRPENQRIEMSGEDAVRVLEAINLVLISLHKIGSYYAVVVSADRVNHEGETTRFIDERGDSDVTDRVNYERETTRFIDEWRVTRRLANARALLSKRFDLTLGDDDMDDLERALDGLNYWSGPQSSPRND